LYDTPKPDRLNRLLLGPKVPGTDKNAFQDLGDILRNSMGATPPLTPETKSFVDALRNSPYQPMAYHPGDGDGFRPIGPNTLKGEGAAQAPRSSTSDAINIIAVGTRKGVYDGLYDFFQMMKGGGAGAGGGMSAIQAAYHPSNDNVGGDTGTGHSANRGQANIDPGKQAGGWRRALAKRLGMDKGGSDPRGLIPYIREQAIKNGVDPDVAVRVAQSEGLLNPVGDNKTSFGAFQLHTGGGMGDDYKRDTGKDPSDPANEKDTIDYAMSHVGKTGWGPWHGAARVGIGARQGLGMDPAALAAREKQRSSQIVGSAEGGGRYTGVGDYNFMGSARANAMGMGDVTHGGPNAHLTFPTGITDKNGPKSILANKYAGPDMAAYLRDLHDAGAPLDQFAGAYVDKPLQHGYGNALDIETGAGSGPDNSPHLYAWAQKHPEQFAEIQARHHMRNLDPSSGSRKHDWGHFEWTPTGFAKNDHRKAAPTTAATQGSLDKQGIVDAAKQLRDRHNDIFGVKGRRDAKYGVHSTENEGLLQTAQKAGFFGAQKHQVEGNAAVHVSFAGLPAGSRTKATADGMFKTVSLNRGRLPGVNDMQGA